MSFRVLFLTPQLPYPLHQGTTLRNFGLINGLAKRGHKVGLISFVEPEQPHLEDTPLAALCNPAITIPAPAHTTKDRIRALIRGKADMAQRRWSGEFADTLREVVHTHPFDIIHIEGIEMASYVPLLKQAPPGAALIYDAHNAEYALQKRIAQQDSRNPRRWIPAIYSAIQTARLTRFENEMCQAADHVIAVSDTDADHLRRLQHTTPITVIPNAISTDEYPREKWEPATIPQPSVVFTGKMDFRPNIDAALWFADEILPLLEGNIHFAVVGQKPHARLDRLREQSNITLTGYVDDIRPYLRAAQIYVAPLRMGSGTRFKLLEAMAMGCAVVSTRIGAEGLEVEDGNHLLLADTPHLFAHAIRSLLTNPEQRAQIGAKAAQLVRDRYDWQTIMPEVESIYAGITKVPV